MTSGMATFFLGMVVPSCISRTVRIYIHRFQAGKSERRQPWDGCRIYFFGVGFWPSTLRRLTDLFFRRGFLPVNLATVDGAVSLLPLPDRLECHRGLVPPGDFP